MKNILVALGLCMLFVITSCENEDTQDELATTTNKTYKSDSLGIELTYPASYELVPNLNASIPISFFEMTQDSSTNYLLRPNMAFNFQEIPPVVISLSEYLKASRTDLELKMKSRNPGFKTFDLDSMQSGENLVGSFKYETPKSADTSFTSKMYLIMQPKRAILINCTSLTPLFSKNEAIFDEFVKSIKLKKK